MKHCGTLRLKTERLVLRRFAPTDAAAMYKNWASDPEVTKFLTWPPHADRNVSKAVLEDWVKSYERKDYYQWAIVPKDNGDEPIGSITAVGMNDDVKMIHIGYCIGRKWWHQGIMSEALNAVMDFFFDKVDGDEKVRDEV